MENSDDGKHIQKSLTELDYEETTKLVLVIKCSYQYLLIIRTYVHHYSKPNKAQILDR